MYDIFFSRLQDKLEEFLIPRYEVEGGKKAHIVKYMIHKRLKTLVHFRYKHSSFPYFRVYFYLFNSHPCGVYRLIHYSGTCGLLSCTRVAAATVVNVSLLSKIPVTDTACSSGSIHSRNR